MSVDQIQFEASDSYRDMVDAVKALTRHVNSLTGNTIVNLNIDSPPSFTCTITNTKTGIPFNRDS